MNELIYFIIALLCFFSYAVFMLLKFSCRLKVTNRIIKTHITTALLAAISFMALVIKETGVSGVNWNWYSLITLPVFALGVYITHSAFKELKMQTIKPDKFVVAGGIYRRVRNPMYLGVILMAFSMIFLNFSVYVSIYCLALFTAYIFIINTEQKELAKRFGKKYLLYKNKTPMLIPRLVKKIR